MQNNSYISVVLPVYNQEKYIAETIESVLSQTYTNFEFLILDDGSTDNSAEIIRIYAAKDTRIKAYFEPNSGKSDATNNLVSKSIGAWCAFLDADDVMMPQRIERQLSFHAANPKANASSSNCYYINENGNMFGTQRYSGLATLEEFKQAAETEVITCAYSGLMVAKEAFVAIGGLRSKYEPCEDFEFFNRLAEKGFVLLVIPEVLMKYRMHPSAVTVRKPLLVLDTINFVEYCLQLRRAGQPEIDFKSFKAMQDNKSWWFRFNRRRFNYSMIYFRSAGFSILSKNYPAFIMQIIASLVLSPPYVVKKVLNHLNK